MILAKDFMMKLLETKAEKRITARDALDHEYLSPNALKKLKSTEESPVNSLGMGWKK